MMSVPGVTFETAWTNRQETQVEGLTIPFISKVDLIQTKEASGRDQDKLDLKKLRKAGS